MTEIDPAVLEALAHEGHIRRAFHPSGKLAIYNYTQRCVFEGNWNDTTRMCRGLILDDQFNVVARPFAKFFNYGEAHAPDLDLDAPVLVTDKLDGSLGILYPDPAGGFSVASRGSFTSDQAVHATAVWNERYAHRFKPDRGLTLLFEIIYPSNRIVVDYHGLDDIVLLGAMERGGGWITADYFGDWPGIRVETHPYPTLRAALEAPPRDGKEGLVIYFPDTHDRVKIKQDDYVQIHRLVFGLTKRKLWERVGIEMLHENGFDAKFIATTLFMDITHVEAILPTIDTWFDDLLKIVPEEFANWVTETTVNLGTAVFYWCDAVEDTFQTIQRDIHPATDRKAYAEAFKAEPKEIVPALFARLDAKSTTPYALRAFQPEHETYKPPEEAE